MTDAEKSKVRNEKRRLLVALDTLILYEAELKDQGGLRDESLACVCEALRRVIGNE